MPCFLFLCLADAADAASTNLALASGDFVESNSATYGTSPDFGQIMATKAALRLAISLLPADQQPAANKLADAGSYGAAAHNLSLLAAAEPSTAVAIGLAAAAVSLVADKLPPHEPPLSCPRGQQLVAKRACL